MLQEMWYVAYVVDTVCLQPAQACSASVGVLKMYQNYRTPHWRRAKARSKRFELPDEEVGNWMAGEVDKVKICA
jgi:hypothetical protein